ncbi:glycosyltransferase family 1 protein [Gramella sp. BOM4]|nr:glycosyltransferase family 1 protein [Christiangramia bathymodioli]
MKIVFICGSLEIGKNGVGDYVLRLAKEFVDRRIPTGILALHDSYVNGFQYESLEHNNKRISVLRLEDSLKRKTKLSLAKEWLMQIDPDWLSLQYVPYSFHKKGIPFFLQHILKRLGEGRKWHIMFHELWLGMNQGSPFKFQIYGIVQEFIIKKMIRSLNPSSIHTHATVYKLKLESYGFQIDQLPLFGNIQFYPPDLHHANSDKFDFAVFGKILPGAKFEEFIRYLVTKMRDKYFFHFLGDNGSELQKWTSVLDTHKINYKIYGWLEEKEISRKLSICDLGITSTPYNLVEKSGTVAAMIEHQLGVICIGADWIPKNLKIENFTSPVEKWSKKSLIDKSIRRDPCKNKRGLKYVTDKFITQLELS